MAKNNLIDIELIKQYVDITEEELMMRLVKDAVGLQKEAERNKRRKETEDRLADPDFRKYVLMFWCDYKYMSQYFTDDEIVAAAARYMSKSNLSTEIAVLGARPEGEPIGYCTAIYKSQGYSEFTEYKGSWARKVRKPATFYIIANSYQCESGDVSKYLLMRRLPYLKDCFKIDVYKDFSFNDWIYIGFPEETKDGKVIAHSLYTPISALMGKDAQAIIDCHLKYWHDYGFGKYDAREKEFIERDDVQAFLKKVAE